MSETTKRFSKWADLAVELKRQQAKHESATACLAKSKADADAERERSSVQATAIATIDSMLEVLEQPRVAARALRKNVENKKHAPIIEEAKRRLKRGVSAGELVCELSDWDGNDYSKRQLRRILEKAGLLNQRVP